MPTLNVKTRKLNYTAADARLLLSCLTLLEAMVEFDRSTTEDSGVAKTLVSKLLAHVIQQRSAKQAKQAAPTPAGAKAK